MIEPYMPLTCMSSPQHYIKKVFTPDNGELPDVYRAVPGGFPEILSERIEKALCPCLGKWKLTPSSIFFFSRMLEADLRYPSWRSAEKLHSIIGNTIGMIEIHLNALLFSGLVIEREVNGERIYRPSYSRIDKLTGYQIILKED